MFRASTLRESTGKARVPGLHNKVTLKADENGLRPSDDHTGVCKYSEATRMTGVRPVPIKESGDDVTAPKVGKKHVAPKLSSNSEATRRNEGRIGVRKAGWNASTSLDSRRTWGTEDDVPPRSPAPANFINSTKLSSAHTAEQKAERSLHQYQQTHPEVGEQIAKAKANGSLVKLNEQVERQMRVERAAAHRDPMAMVPLKKSTDLGAETATKPPFAVANQDEAPPLKGNKRTFDTEALSVRRNAEAERKERMRNGVYRHHDGNRPVPFDTNNGEAAYPEPPVFGKSIPFSVRHAGKARPDAMRTDGTSADMDTMSIERAANKLSRSKVVAHANNPQDFIFGNIPPPSPNKNRTLTEQHEAKCTATNERPSTAGKAHNPRAYQKTSLW